MNVLKKTLMVAFVALIAVSAVFAQAEKEQAEVVVTLSTADNTYGLSSDPDLQQAVTDLIKEKSGVTVNPSIPPLASYTDRINTLINSGDAPDVFSLAQVMAALPRLVAREQVLDLSSYIKSSEKLQKYLSSTLFEIPKTGDGIYFVPYNNPKSKGLYFRQDILDQYGIKFSSNTPTIEEFETELLKLVKAGVVPFTFPKWVDNYQFFYNSFGAWGGVYNKNGQFVDGFQEPQMREALTYLAKLYQEGIINQEFITTENNQMREKVYTAQSAGDIDYLTNYTNYVQNTTKAGKFTDMFVIYGLVGPNGHVGSLNEATQTALCVSAKTKHPDEAFKVIEAIVTDPDLNTAFYGFGIKDKHYTLGADNEIVPTDKAANSGYKYTLNVLSDSFAPIELDKLPFTLTELQLQGIASTREVVKEGALHLGPNHSADVEVGKSDDYDRSVASIKATRESIAAKIIMGAVTLDEGMAEYANFWKSIKGDQILAELNK